MLEKREEDEIFALILSNAKKDDRIRTVLANGSRMNTSVDKDEFQDYDIIFVVNELESFRDNPNWIDVFGKRTILQVPTAMKTIEEATGRNDNSITYLMLFEDGNRIDLQMVERDGLEDKTDSLTRILLDKDGKIDSSKYNNPTDKDYVGKLPNQNEFGECCNEFWWISTYVVKGLAREELLYAKEMLEIPMRNMFNRMLNWYVIKQNRQLLNFGKSNRFLKKYVDEDLWNRIVLTYPVLEISQIWESFKEMTKMFDEMAEELSDGLNLRYNRIESNNVKEYLSKKELKYRGENS